MITNPEILQKVLCSHTGHGYVVIPGVQLSKIQLNISFHPILEILCINPISLKPHFVYYLKKKGHLRLLRVKMFDLKPFHKRTHVQESKKPREKNTITQTIHQWQRSQQTWKTERACNNEKRTEFCNQSLIFF